MTYGHFLIQNTHTPVCALDTWGKHVFAFNSTTTWDTDINQLFYSYTRPETHCHDRMSSDSRSHAATGDSLEIERGRG